MTEIVLIDADITAYQVCSQAEVEWEWDDDVWTLHSDFKEVKVKFSEAIQAIIEATEANKAVLAFTGRKNFRKAVLETYKGNRSGIRKPMHLGRLKEWAKEVYEVQMIDSLEGDDVLGIMATNAPSSTFIYSADKDMKTIPARLWSNDERFVYDNVEEVADWWFMFQTLTGDTTDGYKGCPGVGPKRASDILGPVGNLTIDELWPRVVRAYEAKALTEEDALQQARCARILRNTDFNHSEGVLLWTPPKS